MSEPTRNVIASIPALLFLAVLPLLAGAGCAIAWRLFDIGWGLVA